MCTSIRIVQCDGSIRFGRPDDIGYSLVKRCGVPNYGHRFSEMQGIECASPDTKSLEGLGPMLIEAIFL